MENLFLINEREEVVCMGNFSLFVYYNLSGTIGSSTFAQLQLLYIFEAPWGFVRCYFCYSAW